MVAEMLGLGLMDKIQLSTFASKRHVKSVNRWDVNQEQGVHDFAYQQ